MEDPRCAEKYALFRKKRRRIQPFLVKLSRAVQKRAKPGPSRLRQQFADFSDPFGLSGV